MSDFPYRNALIVGAGAGISESLARLLSTLGVKVGLAARNIDKLQPLRMRNEDEGPDAQGALTGRRESGVCVALIEKVGALARIFEQCERVAIGACGVRGAFERPRALMARGPGAESADPGSTS